MSSFPWWLDAATLEWAADYCELMAIRLADDPRMPSAVGADVCARGLRDAQASVPPRSRTKAQLDIARAALRTISGWEAVDEWNPADDAATALRRIAILDDEPASL